MGKTYAGIQDHVRGFVEAQHLFFVGTAPSGEEGHINVSPKGLGALRVLDEQTVAYLDLVGSGIETAAHLGQNGRICIMLCAFEGPPRIVRLHGQGEIVEPGDDSFDALRRQFPAATGVRSVVLVHVTRVSDSCGYGVPLYRHVGERSQLRAWCERKGDDGLERYQREKNARSIDGLHGLRWTRAE